MNENKDAYKIENFSPVYVINLDDQTDRSSYIEAHFKYWGVSGYQRVSAYDGREHSLTEIIHGEYLEHMSSSEVGCVTSHLKALKTFVSETNAPYAIICEDDFDMSTIPFWDFTWDALVQQFPYDFDVVQLVVENPDRMYTNLHIRFINDFSAACYVITRHHAEKLIKLHCSGDRYALDIGVRPRASTEDVVFGSGKSYALPLFITKPELGSSINVAHTDTLHQYARDTVYTWWSERYPSLEDKTGLLNFNPYLGQFPPGIMRFQQ